MDGQFIVFFLALGVPLVFGACIGAAFRGRFGRGLGLVTLALGLAGLLYGALTFTTYRDGYVLFAWVLQILMAGGVFCFGGACWLAARRKRQGVEKRRGTGGNAEQPAGCSLFSRPPQLSP